MHLVGSNAADGRLYHTFRHPDTLAANAGTWTQFVDIENVAQGQVMRGPFGAGDVSCVIIGGPFTVGDLHFCAVNNAGQVWHAIRLWNFGAPAIQAQWTALGDVAQQAGNVGAHTRISCSLDQGGGLHVVTCTADGNVRHTIRRADGSWFPFGAVKGQAGDRGNVIDVACAADGFILHLVAITNDGSIWHTIRRADGSWFPFGLVQNEAGYVVRFHGRPVLGRAVSCWAGDGRMVAWAITQANDVLATAREPNGVWSPWSLQDVWFPNQPADIAVSGINRWGEHVAAVTDAGGLFHQLVGIGNGDVQGQAGQRGAFRSVALSGG
jgi:hypothetical protein